MNSRWWIGLIMCALFGGEVRAGDAPAVVYTNAAIYTMNPSMPWADSLAISGHEIVAVGTQSTVLASAGVNPLVCDLGGMMVLPGFVDGHVHVVEGGVNETMCFVPPFRSLQFYANRVASCAAQQPGNSWVRVVGASLDGLDFGEVLPVDLLDQAVPDRPVMVIDYLGHAVWTNSVELLQRCLISCIIWRESLIGRRFQMWIGRKAGDIEGLGGV